jgi:hypothetical protein
MQKTVRQRKKRAHPTGKALPLPLQLLAARVGVSSENVHAPGRWASPNPPARRIFAN